MLTITLLLCAKGGYSPMKCAKYRIKSIIFQCSSKKPCRSRVFLFTPSLYFSQRKKIEGIYMIF